MSLQALLDVILWWQVVETSYLLHVILHCQFEASCKQGEAETMQCLPISDSGFSRNFRCFCRLHMENAQLFAPKAHQSPNLPQSPTPLK